eukprot:SAG31_NODE_1147_length_9665_cov_10.571399_3_plen_110_part_00
MAARTVSVSSKEQRALRRAAPGVALRQVSISQNISEYLRISQNISKHRTDEGEGERHRRPVAVPGQRCRWRGRLDARRLAAERRVECSRLDSDRQLDGERWRGANIYQS